MFYISIVELVRQLLKHLISLLFVIIIIIIIIIIIFFYPDTDVC